MDELLIAIHDAMMLTMILSIVIPVVTVLLLAHFLLGRKMLMVHGTRAQRPAGLIRAIFALLRMYWFGYSNTLFVHPDCTVKTRQENREMRKNRPAESVMVFDVEL